MPAGARLAASATSRRAAFAPDQAQPAKRSTQYHLHLQALVCYYFRLSLYVNQLDT